MSLQSTDNIQGFLQCPSGYQEEPCCSRDFFSTSHIGKVFLPICNNAFSINTKMNAKLGFSLKTTLNLVMRESY